MAKLYRLTSGDKEIFSLAATNPNYFTDYYLRTPNSGTLWMPGAKSDKWRLGYERITRVWKQLNEPDGFDYGDHYYTTLWQHELAGIYPNMPAFHHNHGSLFIPYQMDLHLDRTAIRTLIGGYGAGKTQGVVQSVMVHAATLTNFRAFMLAPTPNQALEMYTIAMNLMAGSEYERRFLLRAPRSPNPIIVVGNDHVGESTIEFYAIANREDKLLSLTGDLAVVDQAEHEAIDLTAIRKKVGTRFRGRVSRNGRERIGTITLIANSEDNSELWDIFDAAETDPANYKSVSASSYDNPYLTDRDLERFEITAGQSDEERRVHLYGQRPLGSGDHFGKTVMANLQEERLDQVMAMGLAEQESTGKNLNFVKEDVHSLGSVEWLLPYQKDHRYLVISDPGTKNPPNRDSPPIMIWDITDFPGPKGNEVPVTMAGFVWVYGRDNIRNWAAKYGEMVARYHAVGTNGFDATGYQAGYDQWLGALTGLLAEKINLGGNGKALALNASKVVTGQGLIKMPKAVYSIYNQLARYVYPNEPKGLRQDLVMCFIMSCWWMQRLFYENNEPLEERPYYDPLERYPVDNDDRYGGHVR